MGRPSLDQSSLFTPSRPVPPGAVPCSGGPQPCAHCPPGADDAVPYGRILVHLDPPHVTRSGMVFNTDAAPLCVTCTTREVQRRRASGEDVPPGYEWVPEVGR